MSLLHKMIHKFEARAFRPTLSLWRTLWLNLRCMPLRQALRFPLLVYGKWDFPSLEGEIEVRGRGKVRLGAETLGYMPQKRSQLTLLGGGKLLIYSDVKINNGAAITIGPRALLELHSGSTVSDGAKIICFLHITLGEHSDLTWESQMMDFNSHFVRQADGSVPSIFREVWIGDHCWIGNRSTVMPGTRLPRRTIVAGGSLLNKDYTLLIPTHTLLAGTPAKAVRENVRRVYEREEEQRLFALHSPAVLSGESAVREGTQEKQQGTQSFPQGI